MRYWFLRMIVFWMEYDLQMNRRRLQECKMLIAHDEKRLHELEMELLGLSGE